MYTKAEPVRRAYPYPREPVNSGLINKWMGQKNPTPKPDLQPTGHPVSGQAPHLAARPGEGALEDHDSLLIRLSLLNRSL